MKRRIVNMILSVVLATTIVSSTVSGDSIARDNTTSNSMIDNKQVQYIDEIAINNDSVQIYQAKTKEEYDRLTHIIENRNGKIIIEVSNGTVSDSEGNGTDDCGYYRHYDSEKFSPSDYVQSVFVYNTDTNSTDDILYRVDTLIE